MQSENAFWKTRSLWHFPAFPAIHWPAVRVPRLDKSTISSNPVASGKLGHPWYSGWCLIFGSWRACLVVVGSCQIGTSDFNCKDFESCSVCPVDNPPPLVEHWVWSNHRWGKPLRMAPWSRRAPQSPRNSTHLSTAVNEGVFSGSKSRSKHFLLWWLLFPLMSIPGIPKAHWISRDLRSVVWKTQSTWMARRQGPLVSWDEHEQEHEQEQEWTVLWDDWIPIFEPQLYPPDRMVRRPKETHPGSSTTILWMDDGRH